MSGGLKRIVFLLIFLAAAYTLFVILSGLGIDPLGIKWDFSVPGALGDSFGPLNTFMAAVAAVSAIAAYMSQRQELDQYKLDAAVDRASMHRRDFESTFFNLLTLLRETVKEIIIPDEYGTNPVHGRDAISQLLNSHLTASSAPHNSDDSFQIEFNRSIYVAKYAEFQDELGHYFAYFIILSYLLKPLISPTMRSCVTRD